MGVNEDGNREIIGACEGGKEDTAAWLDFLRHLKKRGLRGVRLFVGDKCLGLVEAIGEVYPDSKNQRCIVHFYRNMFSVVPKGKMKEVAAMLKAIHAQENRDACRRKGEEVIAALRHMKLGSAADKLQRPRRNVNLYAFPPFDVSVLPTPHQATLTRDYKIFLNG